ncbi:Flp family type IVb pilin [Youngiibacter multivorans]|uniref:Pilus assembly protein Flp/PilA n=1 Tax=Youngiibacter multivorans TaxID=937251 RepID=A0ABS4G893_9CLOT|nr:Flp family type IVb pilin [Youngiibacter multivorans]MBP1920793.1 pilus assembly protein Flp/PilA [Youngiibacter multivorans]
MELLKRLWNDEEGQGMVEYGLLVALISVAAIAVIVLIGPELIAIFQSVVDALVNR